MRGDGVTRGLGARRYTALEHRFEVRCDHAPLAAHLDWMLADLADPDPDPDRVVAGRAADDPPPVTYEVQADGEAVTVLVDGEALVTRTTIRRAVGMLVWHINQQAIASPPHGQVVLHAAALARDGAVLVLPAHMEAGKTTLAAGLVDRGWAYLSDEAAVLTAPPATVRAYPKPVSIDPGSQEVLAHWRPTPPPDLPGDLTRGQWQVPVGSRPGGTVLSSGPLAAVVLPRYEDGATTRLTPLSRAHGVARTAECAFAWQRPDLRERFAVLVAAARAAHFAELRSGDLQAACDRIEQWWSGLPAPEGADAQRSSSTSSGA